MAPKIGFVPWNKGLTKKDDERVRRNAMAVSRAKTGRPSSALGKHWNLSKEAKINISLAHKGKPNRGHFRKGFVPWNKDLPKGLNPLTGISRSEKVGNQISETKKLQIQSFPNGCILSKGKIIGWKKMTVIESKVNDLLQANFPGEWKWVGNGTFWIDGKNPDFVNINGKKQVIEVDGCEPWKRRNYGGKEIYAQSRIEHFKEYGFTCLVIRHKELNSLIERLNAL